MASNDLGIFRFLAEKLSGTGSYIAMARTMEAVFTDSVLFVFFIFDAVHEGHRRHGLMESRIKDSHLRGVRHQFLASADTSNIRRLMKRSHITQGFNLLQVFFRNENGFTEHFAAMDNTVTNGIDFIHGFDDTMVGVNKGSKDFLDPIYMIGDLAFHANLILACRRVGQDRTIDTDTFYQAFGDDGFIFHVDQLILNGRTATVNNKNLQSLAS